LQKIRQKTPKTREKKGGKTAKNQQKTPHFMQAPKNPNQNLQAPKKKQNP